MKSLLLALIALFLAEWYVRRDSREQSPIEGAAHQTAGPGRGPS
jgi:hypothetical protein